MKTLIHAKIDRNLKSRIEAQAKADGRSTSNMIERFLERGIAAAEAQGVNTSRFVRQPRRAKLVKLAATAA